MAGQNGRQRPGKGARPIAAPPRPCILTVWRRKTNGFGRILARHFSLRHKNAPRDLQGQRRLDTGGATRSPGGNSPLIDSPDIPE